MSALASLGVDRRIQGEDCRVTGRGALLLSTSEVGPVSLVPAWECGGGFVLGVDRPPKFDRELGGGWAAECRWGSAVAVSLPDGLHVLHATEVQVALHGSGGRLVPGMGAEDIARLLVTGLIKVGVAEVRRVAATWRSVELAFLRDRGLEPVWRREVRAVWGSIARLDRAVVAKLRVFVAVHGA